MGTHALVPIVVDTHILVWLDGEPSRLNKRRRDLLREMNEASVPVLVSAMTLREIAHHVRRGRIALSKPLTVWLHELESHPLYRVVPLTVDIAIESASLGEAAPPDPADQIIIATARCEGVPLMTDDTRIRASKLVPVL